MHVSELKVGDAVRVVISRPVEHERSFPGCVVSVGKNYILVDWMTKIAGERQAKFTKSNGIMFGQNKSWFPTYITPASD